MKKTLAIIMSVCVIMGTLTVGIFADFSTDATPIQETSGFSSSKDESSFGNISANDEAALIPEESFEYVDFAAKIDETAKFETDSVIVSMKRGVEDVNHVYTAEDFPELDVAYVEDLTYLTNQELLDDAEFMANYTQILQIHLNSSSKAKVIDSVDALSARSIVDIASVIPNYEFEVENEPCISPTSEPLYSTNQKQYTDRINLEGAWTSVGNRDLTTVKVAVLDTGVASLHEDLNDNVITGYDACHDNASTITNDVVYNVNNNYKYDHGTAVAGIIGAELNGKYVAGIAPSVSIVPIQFYASTDNVGGFDIDATDFVEVITYLNNNNIPLANYSNTLSTTDTSIISFYTSVINNYFGLFIASAGNNGICIDDASVGNPAKYNCNNIISVMGTVTNAGNEVKYSGSTSGSNYSKEHVDIAAPWEAHTTTYNWSTNTYSHGYFTGTSASAPYVTGVAALIKSVRPELSSNDIKNIILSSASQKSTIEEYCIDGRFLNAEAAVEMAIDYETPEPQTFMEDVNNDGYDDLVYLREYSRKRHLQVFLGSSTNILGSNATYPNSNATPSISDTTRCSVDTLTTDDFKSTDVAFMGDVNGDGRMDMIVHSSTTNKNRKFYVYLGQSDGKFSSAITSTMSNMHDPDIYPCKLFIGNFNNDSYCDFLVHYRSADGKRMNLVYSGKSNGGFNSGITTSTTNSYVESDPVFIMDVTGDGCDDVVVHWSSGGYRQLLVYESTRNRSFYDAVNTATNNRHSQTQFPCKFLTGNFNGDAYDDFLVYWSDLSNYGAIVLLLYPGTSSGSFSTGVQNYKTDIYGANDKLFSADTNSDGRDDIIVHWATAAAGTSSVLIYRGNDNNTFSNKIRTDTTQIIKNNTTTYRVYIGNINGWGEVDLVTEVADAENAYRSRALVNFGTSSGFQSSTYIYNLRTFFYIDIYEQ